MSSLLNEVMILMSCTFLLGLILGWLVWSFGSSKERTHLVSEIDFWKAQLDDARRKRDVDLERIDSLKKEKEKLKARITSRAS